jgi:CheY-like chemotaxis protein
MRVMVVDDEVDVRSMYEQRFRREVRAGQIELHFALSAEEALAFLEANPDEMLILSDINMPGMSGLDLLKAVKEKSRTRKVFMITAYGNEEYHRQAVAYGCDDYLTKPIDFGVLKQKLLPPAA